MRLDVWSDLACPWCYVGKRRLEAALVRVRGASPKVDVQVVWRSFELDPAAPPERDPAIPYAARLAKKYGRSVSEAEGMIARMTEVARGEGLDFRFDRARTGNTFDAHRLVHLGAARGRQDVVKERLFKGHFTDGAALGLADELVRLGVEAGLDEGDVRAALTSGAYADDVRADEEEAAQLGIRGVPFFVIDGRYGISGAQPAEALAEALGRAHAEAPAP